MTAHPPDPVPISTVAEPSPIENLATKHRHPEPAPTVAELPRTELPRVERRTEPPAAELSFRARVEPHGSAEVSARARSKIGVIAVSCVLIVFFIVAGIVLVTRSGGAQREQLRREDLGRCTERMQRTEVIERTCTRDGS
jgi:hypothetical protein